MGSILIIMVMVYFCN